MSAILGILIPDKGWDTSIKRLDVSGKITQRKILEMVVALAKKVETLEEDTNYLYDRSKNPPIQPTGAGL
jgi:hypothetical protein